MRRTTVLTALALSLASPAAAGPEPEPEADVTHADGKTGEEIYRAVVEHRLRAFYAEAELENGNGKGDTRRTRFVMLWKDFRAEHADLSSMTRVEVLWPFDARFMGVHVIKNRNEPAQTFVYVPEMRVNRRWPLRGERVHGSCFTYDDVIPPEAEDFRYRRLADDIDDGRPVYTVELYPRPHAASEHSRIVVTVDQARDIPVRSRYWNAAGELTKELHLPVDRVEPADGSWFPMRWEMRSLEDGCFSTIEVGHFKANPELGPRAFDLGRLEKH